MPLFRRALLFVLAAPSVTLLCGLAVAPVALAADMQITTDWHEEPVHDPNSQLLAGPIAAAVRTSEHIYELHLMCGQDQYGGPDKSIRQPGTVLELAISAFTSDQKPAAIKLRPAPAGEPATADVTFRLGNSRQVTQAFRSEGYPNVVSQAWALESPMTSDNARMAGKVDSVGHALARAVAADRDISVSGVLGFEQFSLALSSDNSVLRQFVAACPVTR